MHSVERSILVPYSAKQMFDLVADCDKYPEFMPWCGGASVSERDEHGLLASITIAFGGLKQTFTTRNRHEYPSKIHLALVDGPFSDLTGEWEFVPLTEDACKVLFSLHYTFSSRTLEALVGPIFNRIANSFIESFTDRAQACDGDKV